MAVASAGPYASLHLAPRMRCQHPTTQVFLQAGCSSCRPTNSVKALKATWTHWSALQKWMQPNEVPFGAWTQWTQETTYWMGAGFQPHKGRGTFWVRTYACCCQDILTILGVICEDNSAAACGYQRLVFTVYSRVSN